ncbi:methyl-accepting chemotaxis protein, partial [Salmonella enterica subsp. enterica]
LIQAAQAGDQAQFKARIPAVVTLDRQYEIVLDKVLALHEKYAKNLNSEAQSNFNSGIGLTVAFCLLFLVVILAVLIFLKRYVL